MYMHVASNVVMDMAVPCYPAAAFVIHTYTDSAWGIIIALEWSHSSHLSSPLGSLSINSPIAEHEQANGHTQHLVQ